LMSSGALHRKKAVSRSLEGCNSGQPEMRTSSKPGVFESGLCWFPDFRQQFHSLLRSESGAQLLQPTKKLVVCQRAALRWQAV
jgi:hypothetical protein